jgi:putative resolvase
MSTFSTGKAALYLGVGVKTLQDVRLRPERTPCGRRAYSQAMLDSFMRRDPPQAARKAVACCRVSGAAQKPDLKSQRRVLEDFCAARGMANVEEVGGGLNLKRSKFWTLMDRIEARQVSHLIIAHKDRLMRFGFSWFERFCAEPRTELLVLNNEQLSAEQEMVQDLLSILHCFSARLYGLRNCRKKPNAALAEDVTLATIAGGDNAIEPVCGPKPGKQLLGRIKRMQRRTSLQKHRAQQAGIRTSRRQHIRQSRLSKLQARLANIRNEAAHKLTTDLRRGFETIVIEDLNVSGIDHSLAGAVLDCGFHEIRRQLQSKAAMRGGYVRVADRFYPSTQIRSCRGCLTGPKGREGSSVKRWICECGAEHERDANAAISIRKIGPVSPHQRARTGRLYGYAQACQQAPRINREPKQCPQLSTFEKAAL